MSMLIHASRRPVKAMLLVVIIGLSLAALLLLSSRIGENSPWTPAEKQLIASLSLANLPVLAPDPSNAIGDHDMAASLGRSLFSDKRLSSNGKISCATCHQPERQFTDGLPVAQAIGISRRNTPSIIGTAYSPWFYWDGRKDSQWSQALAPLEDAVEHGSNRMQLVRLLSEEPAYRQGYQALFGTLPDFSVSERFPQRATPLGTNEEIAAWNAMSSEDRTLVSRTFANLGKLLAAYERTLLPVATRFDSYAAAVLEDEDSKADLIFNADEKSGLRLFIGKARCLECHNGPLFTNNEFHNTGVLPPAGETPDLGRIRVLEQVRDDPFNCLGVFSDAEPEECPELQYMRTGVELLGAHRTPSLRNLAQTGPYMHKGQIDTLRGVLEHYNKAPLALVGHNEAEPLNLSRAELNKLEAFLMTLRNP